MKKIALIALAGLSALAISSCTCAACGGSGLQTIQKGSVYTKNGRAATATHTTTIPCVPCGGTGRVQWAAEASNVINVAKGATDVVSGVQDITGHGHRR